MLYNQEGLCFDSCGTDLVTYGLGEEKYCDDYCFKIAAYIDSASPALLFNRDGYCLDECPLEQVSYKHGDEEYCNAACSDINDIL